MKEESVVSKCYFSAFKNRRQEESFCALLEYPHKTLQFSKHSHMAKIENQAAKQELVIKIMQSTVNTPASSYLGRSKVKLY